MITLNKLSPFAERKPHFERRPLPNSSSVFVSHPNSGIFYRAMDDLIDLCGRYAFFNTTGQRLCLYFLLSTVFAFLGRLLEPLPKFYLTEKRNPVNDYVVKLGLLWTSALLLPFIFFTSKVYTGSNYWMICRHLSRMLVNFVIWFVITAFIAKVDDSTGICSLNAHDNRPNCIRNGGHWFAFEISGHCFLLSYSALTIAEELFVFRHWHLIPRVLDLRPYSPLNVPPNKIDHVIFDQYRSFTPVVRVLFVLSTGLLLLWDVMFLVTNLYYHTWMQNISGLSFAGVSWYLTYGTWYRTPYSPGMPGKSRLKRLDFLSKEAYD